MGRRLLTIVAIIALGSALARAQVTGDPGSGGVPQKGGAAPSDTLYIFQPVHALIDSVALTTTRDAAFGFDILFSNSGYGLGFFYQVNFSETFSGFANVGVSGARNSDEFEFFNRDPNSVHYLTYYVPSKVSRLYNFPFMIGVKQRLLHDVLVDNFRPYANVGIGGTMVLSTPYDREFFNSFGYADTHFAPGAFVGVGAEFGEKNPGLGVNVRYYYLPIEPGIESIRDEAITNFGGIFLSLNVPFM